MSDPVGAVSDITLAFGDGRYRFYLPLKAEIEVERLCGDTPLGVIYDALSASVGIDKETDAAVYLEGGPARRHHARHVIRIAAQYGGEAEIQGEAVKVSPIDATRLVEQFVDGRPFGEVIPVAWSILQATLTGVRLKKKPDAEPDMNAGAEEA